MALARPDWAIQVAFNADPNDPNAVPVWSDLTAVVLEADGLTRGRQYELDEVRAGAPSLTLLDPNEYLNTGNPSSPYSPNVVPYRQLLWQGMWPLPAAGAVNLINTTAGYDPTFETYTNGASLSWAGPVGGTTVTVSNTAAFAGTMCLATGNLVAGSTVQGMALGPFPTIPGRTYTFSAYVRTGAAFTVGVYVQTPATTGTTATVNATYTRLTVTFVATQPTTTFLVQTSGTVSANSIRVDNIQLEPGASASSFVTTGPVIYGVTRPYVERWPSAWEDASVGFLGRCDAVAVDAFGVLAQTELGTEVTNSILAKAPMYYWSLQEGTDATRFGDHSGNGGSALGIWTSLYGATTPIAPGSVPANDMPGDPGGVAVKFTADLVNINNNQVGQVLTTGPRGGTTALTTGLPATAATPWAGTLSVWINTTTPIAGYPASFTIAYLKNPLPTAVSDIALMIGWLGDPDLCARFQTLSGSPSGGFQATGTMPTWWDGKWHNLVATTSQTGSGPTTTTVSLYMDGVLIGTNTTTFLGLLGTSCTTMQIGGGFNQTITSYAATFNGYVSHAAIWSRALSAGEILDLYNAGRGYIGETSGARVARLLSYGWYGQTAIDTGQSTMGVSTVEAGTSLLQACQDVATTENGNFWPDSRGRLVFKSRTSRYLTTTATYVFGENTAGGEYPYEGDFAYDFDPTQVNNDVSVTNQPGGYTARGVDVTSQKRYFPRDYSRSINVLLDPEADDAVTYLLATRKQPVQRVQALPLNPAGNPSLWPVVLGIELGTRVTVKRRSKAANAGTGLTQSADFFVEQISHTGIDLEAGTWTTTLQLSPVSNWRVGLLDDATYGLLDSTMILAY